MKKRALALGLVFALMLGILPAFAAASPFSDVPSNHWGIDGIIAAYEDGVMTGTYVNSSTGERRFSPASHLTLAEWAVMLYRAFYANEPFTVAKENWWNREAAVLNAHHISGANMNGDQASSPVNRFQMAMMICSLLEDKGVIVDAAKVEAAKKEIADLDEMYPMHQEPVATCWALGIIKGVGGNRFNGEGKMERAQAATVYLRAKGVLDAWVPPEKEPPARPTNYGPVGTFYGEKVILSTITHAPITDYWSQQSAEIRNLTDKDYFNAACQTIKDSHMLMARSDEANVFGTNPYYNYAVVPYRTANEKQSIVASSMIGLGAGGGRFGIDNTYRGRLYKELGPEYDECMYYVIRTHNKGVAEAIQPILARLNDSMTDRQKAEICIQAVVDRIDYEVGGGADWTNGKRTGDCDDYAGMLWQILSSAGIPTINTGGTVAGGKHAWVQAKLEDKWYIIDGTMAEVGFRNGGIMPFAEHEAAFDYSSTLNNNNSLKVARALIDAAYSG